LPLLQQRSQLQQPCVEPLSAQRAATASIDQAEHFEGYSNKRFTTRDGPPVFQRRRVFSWQKAHEKLGYKPKFDLARAITQTVA
jgi:nucleoside-diphosphate-sugar epimerase